jgi:septum formation protein
MGATARALPSFILASASPRRADLLRGLGAEFTVVPSQVTELHHEEMTAMELARINAYRKARWVAKKHPDQTVLGADTLVYLEDKLFGKPSTVDEAYRMLEELQGRTHQVVTAVCLLHLRDRHQKLFSEMTAVTFRPLDAVAIQRYLIHVNPLDKAGAYAIQEQGELLIESISGSWSNVVGLPTERLLAEFEHWRAAEATRD